MHHTICAYSSDPRLAARANAFVSDKWPEFMFHDSVANALWSELTGPLADFQFAILDETGELAGFANSIPFVWDGGDDALKDEGWDWVFEQGVADLHAGRTPNALSALQIVLHPAARGSGLAARALDAMRDQARKHGLRRMVAPVRPTLKHLYPLTRIDDYILWEHPSGGPFDPWLRTHWRLGARIVKPAPRSMRVPGTVAEWELWTGLRFPQSGPYVVQGALQPIDIDRAHDHGEYVEPNVWMEHTLTSADSLGSRRV